MRTRSLTRVLAGSVALLLMGVGLALSAGKSAEPAGGSAGIPAEVVAQYVYEVIQADRTLYTTHVVERMKDQDIVLAVEAWRTRNALPLPAQMLMLSGLQVRERGSGLHYRLASLWPIYEENGPATKFEEKGLRAVADDPSRPYTQIIKRGERRFFKAVYADKAVSKSCVGCHNGHLQSPRRNYKLNDVMGGVIISFPLDSREALSLAGKKREG